MFNFIENFRDSFAALYHSKINNVRAGVEFPRGRMNLGMEAITFKTNTLWQSHVRIPSRNPFNY